MVFTIYGTSYRFCIGCYLYNIFIHSLLFGKYQMKKLGMQNFVVIFEFYLSFQHSKCVREKCNVLYLCIKCSITYTFTAVTPPIIQSSRNKPILSDIYQSFLAYRFSTQTSFVDRFLWNIRENVCYYFNFTFRDLLAFSKYRDQV